MKTMGTVQQDTLPPRRPADFRRVRLSRSFRIGRADCIVPRHAEVGLYSVAVQDYRARNRNGLDSRLRQVSRSSDRLRNLFSLVMIWATGASL
jgi:hypothetical protein